MGKTAIPCYLLITPMSENEQPGQDLLEVEGILDLNDKNTGTLLDPSRGGKTTPHDPFLPKELVRRFKLRKGSIIKADANPDKSRPNPKVRYIHTVDGEVPLLLSQGVMDILHCLIDVREELITSKVLKLDFTTRRLESMHLEVRLDEYPENYEDMTETIIRSREIVLKTTAAQEV